MDDVLTTVHVAVRDGLRDVFGPVTSADKALVLVACSGGPDSLTLAAVTVNTARAHGFAAGAVVVDHGWSAEASAAGERAAVQCRELGLDPVELVMVDAGGPVGRAGGGSRGGREPVDAEGPAGSEARAAVGGSQGAGPVGGADGREGAGSVRGSGSRGGPEAVARAARYAALQEAADRLGAAAVLLGHTLDDQAETVLLGLGRGSGARSLAGMPQQRGVFRRPFLELRREVVASAGAALGLHPWHDPANDDPAYTRVRVRRLAGELERALGRGTAEALARSASMLREDADALDALAAELLERALTDPTTPSGAAASAGSPLRPLLSADREPLCQALPAVRRRALLALARKGGCPGGALNHRHALALEQLVLTGRGQVALPGGRRAEVTYATSGSGPGRGSRVSLFQRIVAG